RSLRDSGLCRAVTKVCAHDALTWRSACSILPMTLMNLAIQRVYNEQPPLPQVSAREGHHVYPRHAVGVPPGEHRSGRYLVRFALFNLELREGLMESYATGLDSDAFDVQCHHLLVIEQASEQVVGTYRLMSAELGSRRDLYTATEFDLSSMPDHVIERGAEVG